MSHCEECGGPLTTERNAVRRYELGGLPHVELRGVEVSRCEKCGQESIAVQRIGQLHRLLAQTFVSQKRMIAPLEIRFLRKHIGLSGAEFAQRMGVTRETVSRWETGAQPMGAVADRLLRLLLITHEPSKSYAIDDVLQRLTDTPAPERLAPIALQNSRDKGWTTRGRQSLAIA